MRVPYQSRGCKLICLCAYALLIAADSTTADNQGDIVAVSSTDPVQAANLVQQIPTLPGNISAVQDFSLQVVFGDSDSAQLPWNTAVPFIQTPNTTGSPADGWQMIPDLPGFDLNRTWEIIPGVIMPFYIKSGLDPLQVKRAVVTMPGKPRDAWKYANLYRNALSVVEANTTSGVALNTVMIISPVWLNQMDLQAGAAKPNEIVFHGSSWQHGGASVHPALNRSLSTYAVIDNFTDMLFNKRIYPNMNQVVIAGHSMGGQAAHRYAVLKKQKRYDDNMSYWVGNPGSWTFLSGERPYSNASCTSTYDTWHYGIGQNTTKITKYARNDVIIDKQAVITRYLNRKVHMSLGLLDYGPGDTHCQALDQGGSHLDRGSQMVLHLAKVNGGTFPPAQTVDFIANTSHQDYAMISANQSLYWLFEHDYDQRYPNINATNPSDILKPRQKGHRQATHGETLLASTLMAGSLLFVIAFFTILPYIFPVNWTSEEDEPYRKLSPVHDISMRPASLADVYLQEPDRGTFSRGPRSHDTSSYTASFHSKPESTIPLT